MRPLTDQEYEEARSRSPRSLDICPTCEGTYKLNREAGVKAWESKGYRYRGEHHDCDCKTQMALYRRYLLANIGDQYMRLNWDDYEGPQEVNEAVASYIENWKDFLAHGFGLTFSSQNLGVGKTFASATIGKALIKKGQKVYFQDFVQMIDAFLSDDRSHIESKMKEATFLIIDDVMSGKSEKQTDLYGLKFEVVIRHRTNFNLPTIFTTNMTEDQFEKAFERIYSLTAPKQMWIAMNGNDYRKDVSVAEETALMIRNGERRPIV